MDALSSLITKKNRSHKYVVDDRFQRMFDYVQILDLKEAISQMKIIHVAGTKGKGSTCVFTESILRNCGFRTGVDICKEKFLMYFWCCWNRLKTKCSGDMPMPTLFHFLALLAFKIFADEQVDVVIIKVGLGGKIDATNVIQTPIVCGITPLGYDHTEILDIWVNDEVMHLILGRYKHELAKEQKDDISYLVKKQRHKLVTLEILREFNNSRNRREKEGDLMSMYILLPAGLGKGTIPVT